MITDILSERDAAVVYAVLVEELGVQEDQLIPDARLQEDLGADSLAIIEISMSLEDKFNITLPDEDLENVSTVQDVFEVLAKHLERPKR